MPRVRVGVVWQSHLLSGHHSSNVLRKCSVSEVMVLVFAMCLKEWRWLLFVIVFCCLLCFAMR